MLISVLFESPEDDVEHSRQTLAAYHAISKLVSSTEPGFEIEMSNHRQFHGFDLKPLVEQFPCLAETILLVAVRQPNTNGVSGSVMNFPEGMHGFRHAIAMHGMRSFAETDIAPFVNSTGFLVTFRHEFLHMLDITRTNNKITGTRVLDPRKDKAGYFNDPAEFNAFTHDIARSLSDVGEHPDEARDYAEGFYDFHGDARADIAQLLKQQSGVHKQFLDHLTPDRRRALLRRLYKLHATYVAPAFR